MDEDDTNDETVSTALQCFSQIQSCTVPDGSTCLFCPSMDLIAVYDNEEGLELFRTVSFQKVASCIKSCQDICWSPDGRSLALVAHNDGTDRSPSVFLFDVERGMSVSSSEQDGIDAGFVHEIEPTELSSTTMSEEYHESKLIWSCISKPHPSWNLSTAEKEREEEWRHRKRYVNRASHFLPPSAYVKESLLSSSVTATTPLSLLCLARCYQTSMSSIDLFLHGRYHVATLPVPASLTSMALSSDLTHLVSLHGHNKISIHHLPSMSDHRYQLQVVASLHSSIQSHLHAICDQSKEISAAWQSAVKPWDVKLNALANVLKKYAITEDLSTVLLRFIAMGHTTEESNALEQFFTGVQMNEQLIKKLVKTLFDSVAKVESSARKGILAPSRSLVFDAGQLIGLESVPEATVFLSSAKSLLISAEMMISDMVEFRCRLLDFVAWMRSVSTTMKARGTAAKSVQSETAKKFRLSEQVICRIVHYLSSSDEQIPSCCSPTERVLGVAVSGYFQETSRYAHCSRPPSPTSSAIPPIACGVGTEPLSIVYMVSRKQLGNLYEVAKLVLENPQSVWLGKNAKRQDLLLPGVTENQVCAIHTRIGCDDPNHAVDDQDGLFYPSLIGDDKSELSISRQWTIVCLGHNNGFEETQQKVQILALPMRDLAFPYCLTTELVLPTETTLLDIGFYGDDGKSSLFPEDRAGAGKEGRQKLGLLVERRNSELGSTVELWVVDYNDLVYQHVDLTQTKRPPVTVILALNLEEECSKLLRPVLQGEDEESENAGSRVLVRTRRLDIPGTAVGAFLLCGSRGVGGIQTVRSGTTKLTVFDLEEDEEDSDDEDENDDEHT